MRPDVYDDGAKQASSSHWRYLYP